MEVWRVTETATVLSLWKESQMKLQRFIVTKTLSTAFYINKDKKGEVLPWATSNTQLLKINKTVQLRNL